MKERSGIMINIKKSSKILLIALFIISNIIIFTGCGKDDKKDEFSAPEITTAVSTVDSGYVKALAQKGQIFDDDYLKLGILPQTIFEKYENAHENTAMRDSSVTEIQIENIRMYYKNPDINKGISFIAVTENPFDFEMGMTDSSDIIACLGEPAKKDSPKSKEVFFIMATLENIERYTYNFGQYSVEFYFEKRTENNTEENTLFAAAIFDSALWTGYNPS